MEEVKEEFGFKELIIWQKAIGFAVQVINKTEKLKSDKKHYRITEQIEASAASIAANIAEEKGDTPKKNLSSSFTLQEDLFMRLFLF